MACQALQYCMWKYMCSKLKYLLTKTDVEHGLKEIVL